MPTQVPAARIVRQRGMPVTPRAVPLRERAAAAYDALGDGPRGFIAAVVGLWPITAVVALALGMCWAAVVAG